MNRAQCRAYLERIETQGIKLGLDNIRTLLAAFGNPQQAFPAIHVAGTNGKGSVCAMLAEILMRHGLRVGLYTSPHLVRVEERIRVGRETIGPHDFCRFLSRIRREAERLERQRALRSPLTHFEHLTALALLYFREKRVDIAVLEVGMGGRFDATNVVVPLVSVITTISRDHEQYLGKSATQIAGEKAGIIKPGVPVVCGVPRGAAYRAIKRRAREIGAPFLGVWDQGGRLRWQRSVQRFRFQFDWGGEPYRFSPGLAGLHQGRNAAAAIAAASVVSGAWKALKKAKILQGVEKARWPGRLEVLGRRPLVVADGAHNEEGSRALAAHIQDFIRSPVVLVFAVMRDKNIRPMVRALFPRARRIVLTSFPYRRAAGPEEVLAFAREYTGKIILESNPGLAIRKAVSLARAERGAVVVCGSLFLVGEVKKLCPLKADTPC